MRVTASICREQEALQRDIAENDPLENRRKIAAAAAVAWHKEAVDADKRAAREAKRRAELEAAQASEGSVDAG